MAEPPPVGGVGGAVEVPPIPADPVAAVPATLSDAARTIRGSEPQPVAMRGRGLRAGTTIAGHTLVDALAFTVPPLMPLLATRLFLSDVQVSWLLATASICSGGIQPIVAWLSDRFHTRVFGTIGFASAVVAVSMIGLAQNFWQLMALQVIGTAGVGAFHPPAAAAVGNLAGARRSQWISGFFVAGMLGGILGNVFAPVFVGRFGLEALLWLIAPGFVLVAAVGWALHKAPHTAHDAHEVRAGWSSEELRARWGAIWLLYAGNVLRFTVNMALVYLYQRWARDLVIRLAGGAEMTDELGQTASELNGPMQAAMQLGMGGMGLAAGLFISVRHEKAALVTLPIMGAIAVAAFPLADRLGADAIMLAFPLSVLAGVGFGGLIPVTITVAQRLLPHKTGMASGLMLGGAWCFAAVGPIAAERLDAGFGIPVAMWATAGALGLSAILSACLPGALLRRSAGLTTRA